MLGKQYYFDDFTEENYKRLIEKLTTNYKIIEFSYEDILKKDKVVLLRHDVDASLNRAYRLAQIEYGGGVKTTYFIHLHNMFYSILEQNQFMMIKNIIRMGHKIGLHFDFDFYKQTRDIGSGYALEEYAKQERKMLESLFEVSIDVVSFHNPEAAGVLNLQNEYYAGMVNAYSRVISECFKYCSDSNGYWRFERLEDVIDYGYDKLHILLHPEWWTPDLMSPYDRIRRCVIGRTDNILKSYDRLISSSGRENVGYNEEKVDLSGEVGNR